MPKRIDIRYFRGIVLPEFREILEEDLDTEGENYAVIVSIFTTVSNNFRSRSKTIFVVKVSIKGITARTSFEAFVPRKEGRYRKGKQAEEEYGWRRKRLQKYSKMRLTVHCSISNIKLFRTCTLGSRCYEYPNKLCSMVWVEKDLKLTEFSEEIWLGENKKEFLPLEVVIYRLYGLISFIKRFSIFPGIRKTSP